MYILNCNFSKNEKNLLDNYLGKDYIILNKIENECFVLNMKGEFYYNDCFAPTNSEYFKNFRYNKANPKRIIKVYDYYLMETVEEKGHWYRGEQDENGNIKFDSFAENLEFAIRIL